MFCCVVDAFDLDTLILLLLLLLFFFVVVVGFCCHYSDNVLRFLCLFCV